MAGKLFRISKTGAATVVKDGFKNSADIGYDAQRRLIAVPEMGGYLPRCEFPGRSRRKFAET